MISHLGAMISVVNGALLARRFKKVEGIVGATCVGEGGTSTGAFHEALNQAAIERLPLVLVVANNQFAYSTPNSRQFAGRWGRPARAADRNWLWPSCCAFAAMANTMTPITSRRN